ncbi:GNAT family N-acetyltransferase [Phormidium tenue FACHB-886]|nr:GNAT family N-acetyltransferase [Phormidium tenue FACHB-886]
MASSSFRRSFAADPTLSAQLFPLLEAVFGIDETISAAKAIGASWEAASTPFIRFADERAVTHVGVLELPLWLMGAPVTVGGIHAVCTHPHYRRRGYYREVMAEVMDYCGDRYDTLILTTAQPELYEPFGFRQVTEHRFTVRCSTISEANKLRLLNFSQPEDVQLLHQHLEDRQPVSRILGVIRERSVFCFNEINQPLYYAKDLDLIVVMQIEETKLKLFDLVGTQICELDQLLAAIPQRIEQVEIYFSPDRLNVAAAATPHVLGGAGLMVRGNFAAEGEQFMLPHSARC